jgi:hypothetical protein
VKSVSAIKGRFGRKMPYAWASLAGLKNENDALMVLIDTGASYNFISQDGAEHFGVDTKKVKSGGYKLEIAGVDGHKGLAYGWNVTLLLKSDYTAAECILMQDIMLYLIDETIEGFPILLGGVNTN